MKFNRKIFTMAAAGVMALVLMIGGLGARPSSAQLSSFGPIANSQNQFTLDFYQQLRDDNEDNLIFSGYSVWQALAMVYAGARGTTETQMNAALHYDLPQSELHTEIGNMNAEILSRGVAPDDAPEGEQPLLLNIANGLWSQAGLALNPDYLNILSTAYGSELFEVDFVNTPAQAIADEINGWISNETEGKIEDALSPDVLSPATRMVLANAIYFKGTWLLQFYPEATADAPFSLNDGSTVDVPMMRQVDDFGYAVTDTFVAIELPYAGNSAAMLVIMPLGDFAAFEAGLTLEAFDAIRLQTMVNYGEVDLSMPRFEMTTEISLPDTLKAMGMTDAFDPAAADFSGMATTDEGNLFISDVLHQAVIKVDENGTEAAAVTVVIVEVTAAPAEEPVEICLDRPFIYAIYDRATNAILFMGRVMNPAAE